ncbi:hypothetical protein GWP43_05970 [Treponema vincentii]|uniref:Flavodoxin n=1 Tax=Treponema vincentii TaxID=69710 RepID=A0A6P1XZW5_9SPIR|nr:hypothetical protein [Treponema vincentii]QHX43068.1 hypothetical protein GWP43_05970 [Treponema vincentii]
MYISKHQRTSETKTGAFVQSAFCTHAGSGLSNTVKTIASKCPRATVLNGFAMSGQTAQNSQAAAKRDTLKWIDGIKLK